MQTKEIAEGNELQQDLPSKTVKDGNGNETLVIDLDRIPESIMPKSGIVVYETTRKSSRNAVQNISYRCTKDHRLDIMIGWHTGIDNRTKEIKYLPIMLQNLNTFDLSVPSERKKAIILKYSAIVEGSPNESRQINVPKFRVHDSEKAAQNDIKRVLDGQRAVNVAIGLAGEELLNMARNLGILTEKTSHGILTAEVLKRAEKNPQEFLQIWENPNRQLLTILTRCLNTGVITHDALDGYHYDGRFLGHNEPVVFEWFKKYPDVSTTLDIKSKEKLKQSEKSMADAPAVKDRKDLQAENLALQKRLADLESKMQDQTAESARNQHAEEKEADPLLVIELDDLKAEGAKYKLKALHLYKPTRESIDKLIEKLKPFRPVLA